MCFAEYTDKTWETVCGFLPTKSFMATSAELPEIPPTAIHYADGGVGLFDFLAADGYQQAGVLFNAEQVGVFLNNFDYKNLMTGIAPEEQKNKIHAAVKKFVESNSKAFPTTRTTALPEQAR